MKFQVKGADRKSGRDLRKTYEARSEEAAKLLAKGDGILVETVDLIVEEDGILPPMPVAIAGKLSPVEEVANAKLRYDVAPPYTGLKIAGSILTVYAVICYALGVLALFLGLMAMMAGMTSSRPGSAGGGVLAAITMVGPAIGLLLAGGLAHGIGAGCYALRDIAKNSWR